ncbi:MAG: diacylglycerol kinase family protein [Clostridia bacterium]|nr:diacylglycerol kinase family protein [Clostridia bacterium]
MAISYILYNGKAGNGNGVEIARSLCLILRGETKILDMAKISDYRVFLTGLNADDSVILAGGDGTLNRFANDIEGIGFENEILYFPCGTGNDFARDLGYEKECNPFPVTNHLRDLPQVTVNDRKSRFINGIGYGIDGYCCKVGDELKRIPGKKINYAAIAIRGLLFHYKPTNARITVDGKTHHYKRVWLAPTMNGRFYGGGMMPTPMQERNSGTLSCMVFHGSGKLRTLMIFPSLFKGEHVKHKKQVEILSGKDVTVEFDRPVPLQIDGETVLNVSSYRATFPGQEGLHVKSSVTCAHVR